MLRNPGRHLRNIRPQVLFEIGELGLQFIVRRLSCVGDAHQCHTLQPAAGALFSSSILS